MIFKVSKLSENSHLGRIAYTANTINRFSNHMLCHHFISNLSFFFIYLEEIVDKLRILPKVKLNIHTKRK